MQIDQQAARAGRTSVASRASVSLRVLAALAIGALLYFAQAAFVPIALAVLLALVLTAPVEALHRIGLPRKPLGHHRHGGTRLSDRRIDQSAMDAGPELVGLGTADAQNHRAQDAADRAVHESHGDPEQAR